MTKKINSKTIEMLICATDCVWCNTMAATAGRSRRAHSCRLHRTLGFEQYGELEQQTKNQNGRKEGKRRKQKRNHVQTELCPIQPPALLLTADEDCLMHGSHRDQQSEGRRSFSSGNLASAPSETNPCLLKLSVATEAPHISRLLGFAPAQPALANGLNAKLQCLEIPINFQLPFPNVTSSAWHTYIISRILHGLENPETPKPSKERPVYE
jgi:hypothetical protein